MSGDPHLARVSWLLTVIYFFYDLFWFWQIIYYKRFLVGRVLWFGVVSVN
jgi:hypothetical protein